MIGETIGNFVVVSRLGRGGMGEVFLAKHKDLDTPVAIKVLNEDISGDRDHVQRFFNEARIVSKIKHAGIVKIFDSGFHDDHAYLIMELLEGESVAARIERDGPMPLGQVVDLGRQVASVLDATHRSGVIHRDLKPDNIYLVGDDERASGERVKVLDFGIAKLSGTLASASPKTSGTMGTPAYMAPEQWGDSAQVDWRADAYSLGCVVFELACARPPFLASTIPEAYTKHVHTAPPSPRSLRPDLSEELDALILRLLAKEPAERAVSMGQVVRELEEISTGKAVPRIAMTRPSSPPAPAMTMTTLGGSAAELELPSPRRRVALVGGIAATGGLIVFLVLVMTHATQVPSNERIPAAAPAPAVLAPVTPPPAAVPPPPPTAVSAPPPAAGSAPPSAAVSAPPPAAVSAPPPAAVAHPKKPTPHPRAGSGSAAKPSDDDIMGGRL